MTKTKAIRMRASLRKSIKEMQEENESPGLRQDFFNWNETMIAEYERLIEELEANL